MKNTGLEKSQPGSNDNSTSKKRGFDKVASSKMINTNSQAKKSPVTMMNNAPLPFPTDSINSNDVSLRRDSNITSGLRSRSLKKESAQKENQN